MACDPIKLFVSVGEESADLHTSRLCRALRTFIPNMELFGFGGPKMKAEGVEIIYPLPELALIGFVEVIKKLLTVYKVEKLAMQIWKERKPDAILLVDFPGLHLRLAKYAHESGIPVIYYIAPQAWAWREKRVHMMRKVIDRLLVIFPFEEPFFRSRGIETRYVGHPLAERIPADNTPTEPLHMIPSSPRIGLLPGSRSNELRHLMPIMIKAASILRDKIPHAHFVLPLAQTITESMLSAFSLPNWIEVCRDPTYEQRKKLTFAWTCSGTATVENALLGLPMAVVFRTGRINMFLGRRLVRIPYIGMVNLIAQKGICPEFIQEQCQPETLAQYAEELLSSPSRYMEMKRDLAAVREKMGEGAASAQAAKEIMHFLEIQKGFHFTESH
ncbi:MAG: lipid-A-disaccharide synthase [Candidatus Omnitrophota bacterium]|jgi:lipid-A-disaccharide synthase|nr:MAG: lipid-A-disaccharide synthase [Candidatus Omnitrophota bacterium]